MPYSIPITTVHPLFHVRISYKEAKTLPPTDFDVTLIGQHDLNRRMDEIRREFIGNI